MTLRRHGLGWIVLGGSLVAAVVLVTAGTSSLRHSALEQREATLAAEVSLGVNHLSALEWQARTEHGVSGELRTAILRTRRQVEQSFRKLTRLEGGDTYRNLATYHAYTHATDRELDLLAAGRLSEAVEVDQHEVDPRAAALTSRIAKQTRALGEEAEIGGAQAQGRLLAALIAAGVLVALLVWQFALQHKRRRADQELLRRSNELSRQRDEFVASVSHELRTPLTSICGYAELLTKGATLGADEDRWVQVIGRNADRLHKLVTDLLLVAEVNAGKFALEFGDVDLSTVVADAVEAAEPSAESAGLTLTDDREAQISLRGDAARLAQVLDNLLSNAIKFTPAGGSVSVRTTLHDGTAVLEVADSGLGIAPADQQLLFERFYRTEQAAKSAVQGTGLGLAISKAIVEAHSGTIRVANTPGAGTTFRIELPVEDSRPAGPTRAQAPTLTHTR
jgi:signal transduction histidine kinase